MMLEWDQPILVPTTITNRDGSTSVGQQPVSPDIGTIAFVFPDAIGTLTVSQQESIPDTGGPTGNLSLTLIPSQIAAFSQGIPGVRGVGFNGV
jgi:hypothetical protein